MHRLANLGIALTMVVILGLVSSCSQPAAPPPAPAAKAQPPAAAAPTTAPAAPAAKPAAPTSAPAATSSSAAAARTLLVAHSYEPASMDWPAQYTDGLQLIFGGIYEPLVNRDPKTMKPVPALAERWEEREPGHWRFYLRQGVKFQDGSEFTSKDVVDTAKWVISSKSMMLSQMPMKDVVAVDPRTVDIILSNYAPQLVQDQLWMYIFPSKLANNPADAKTQANGTGPYKLKSWDRGDNLVLEANPTYWGPQPSIKTVKVLFRKEDGVRAAMLKAGQADVATNMPPDQVAGLPRITQQPSQEMYALRPNINVGNNPLLADERLRQAIAYAVDRKALADTLLSGKATLLKGQQPALPSFYGYNSALTDYSFDLAKAKALVNQAGATGKEITMVATSGRWMKDREMAQALANMIDQTGLKVKLLLPEFSVVVDYITKKNVADLTLLAPSSDGLSVERIFRSYYLVDGVTSMVKDDKLDAMIKDAYATNNADTRETKLKAVNAYNNDHVYMFWFFANQWINGTAKDVDWDLPVDGRIYAQEMRIAK